MICSGANRFLAISTSLDPAESYHRGWIPKRGAGQNLRPLDPKSSYWGESDRIYLIVYE